MDQWIGIGMMVMGVLLLAGAPALYGRRRRHRPPPVQWWGKR